MARSNNYNLENQQRPKFFYFVMATHRKMILFDQRHQLQFA
jgi:hypothetical protein